MQHWRTRIAIVLALAVSLLGQGKPAVSPKATLNRLMERVVVLTQTLASIRKVSDLKAQFERMALELKAAGIFMKETKPGTEVRIGVSLLVAAAPGVDLLGRRS